MIWARGRPCFLFSIRSARASSIKTLLDFSEDGFLRQDVTLGMAHGPVEGAEGAIFRAEVGVIDVAVDDVGDYVLGMPAAADGVCLHADTDEIVRRKQIEGFLTSDHA